MHGRLKVKTTAAQAAAKLKEREEKKNKYQAATKAMMNMRKAKSYDKPALDLTTKLLQVNPDSSTVWNYRREILNDMSSNENDKYEEILIKELYVTETCLLNNPKSYGTWHHRSWVLQKLVNPSWSEELDMCDKYLKLDARNFHCWDHRRVVVRLSKHSLQKELEFTQTLIDANLSNYSAWHYRSKLLPLVYPPADSSSLPIHQIVFLKELKNVVSAVFTDPSDQSPWFFLRWLLREKHNHPRLAQVGGYESDGKNHIALVMSKSTSLSQLKDVMDIENFNLDDFKSLDDEERIWILRLQELSDLTIHIQYGGKPVTCGIISSKQLQPPTFLNQESKLKVDNASWDAIRDIRDNCLLLEEIDPDNKWVLLTLVDFLKIIDFDGHLTDILGYLDKLQDIDPLRKNYYVDAKNKIKMEAAMRTYITQGDGCFSLKGQNATKLYHPQLLAFAKSIDLSWNSLQSCGWTKYLLSVRDLTLDENNIRDISPLCCLKGLNSLSVINCSIDEASPEFESIRRIACKVETGRGNNPKL